MQVQVPASQLIDPSKEQVAIRFWHDQLFSKPPRHGGVVAWLVITMTQELDPFFLYSFYYSRHQDYSYWTRTTPMKHITVSELSHQYILLIDCYLNV